MQETTITCLIRFMNFYEVGFSKEREVSLTATDVSGFWYSFRFKPTEPYFGKIIDAWKENRELIIKGTVVPSEYPFQIQTLIDVCFVEPMERQ